MVTEWLGGIQEICGDLFRTSFYIETLVDSILSPVANTSAYEAVYFYCSMLLVIKLLWKGWNVYVLWSNGSPEVSPGELLKGAAWAIVVTAAFPLAYDVGIAIAMELVNTVLNSFQLPSVSLSAPDLISQIGTIITSLKDTGVLMVFAALVFIILLILLIFRILGQGTELFIFRLGVPIAAIGLVDSDGGAWSNYIQILFKQIFSVMVQYFCIVIGIKTMLLATIKALAVGIAFEITAFATPKLLSQVLTPKTGGHGAQTVSTLAMVVRTFAK